MSTPSFCEIAVLGPGLLGGSLALALRGRARVRLWGRRIDFIEEAQRIGATAVCTLSLEEAVRGADLVILCTPVETMAGLAEQMQPFLGEMTVVTDVGSVKLHVCEVLTDLLGPSQFLGSHPMAGSEQSGLSAAKADLFRGATCILTPTENSADEIIRRLTEFWTELGCGVVSLSPAEHDRQMGLISHLPHLLAGCLVNAARETNAAALQVAGQGFRDCTRIAGGPPEMWSGILQANRQAVLEAFSSLKLQIECAETLLRDQNDEGLRIFLQAAKTGRDGIIRKVKNGGD